MREYTGLPETMPGLESITTNDRNQPLSPLTHNTGNVGDSSHYWNTLWTERIVGAETIQTINDVASTDNGDAYGLLTMNGDGLALDKDGTALPLWGMTASYYRVAGAWVARDAAFSFKQWNYATEIDPYSDTAKTVYFITKNKARDANIEHIFAPSVDLHGRLGNASYRWLTAHIDTITPGTIDFATTDVTDCLDEDTMVSDSATKLATQQSIKAYVDSKNAWEHIETITTDASEASIIFSGISSVYKVLRITALVKIDSTVGAEFIRMRFNADVGNNYYWMSISNVAGAPTIQQGNGVAMGWIGSADDLRHSQIEILIQNVSASLQKEWKASFGIGFADVGIINGYWDNAVALISSITIYPDADNFDTSKFILEGCLK